jgi:hypothetical protein
VPDLAPIRIDYPPWVSSAVEWERGYCSDEEKMRLAIDLSRRNVEERTGGPFGAAVFEIGSGRPVAVGVNSVVRLNNCTLHGLTPGAGQGPVAARVEPLPRPLYRCGAGASARSRTTSSSVVCEKSSYHIPTP